MATAVNERATTPREKKSSKPLPVELECEDTLAVIAS